MLLVLVECPNILGRCLAEKHREGKVSVVRAGLIPFEKVTPKDSLLIQFFGLLIIAAT